MALRVRVLKKVSIFNTMKLVSLLQRPFCLSLCLNLAFLLLCLGIGGVHFGSMDDYFMSAIVTGAYGGEFDPHTLFVNGVYAYFLKPFYALFPGVNWYFIFELVAVFASFAVFTYFMLRQIEGRLGIVLSVFLLACLTPDFYLELSFTQCATAATAAGILLLYFGNSEHRWQYLLIAIPFLVAGIVFRKEGFLLGIPFAVALLAWHFWKTRKVWMATLAVLAFAAGAYFALQSFNRGLFNDNRECAYYLAYQGPRSLLGDGAFYDSEAIYDELEERGLHGQDFRVLERWVFYDTEAFSLDSLKPIVDVVYRNRYELNKAKMPVALLYAVANSFLHTNAWCWVVLCLLLFFATPKRAGWYAWGSLALISLCLTYLLMQNRVVYHVESGIWLYAVICAIPFVRLKGDEFGVNARKLLCLLMAMAALSFVFALSTQRNEETDHLLFGSPKMPAEWREFLQYAGERPNDVFLLHFNPYKALAIYKDPAYRAAAPGSWGNIVPIGYWNINLPGMKRELEKRGVTNPLRDIVKGNVYVMSGGAGIKLEYYYKSHYQKEFAIDTVQKFGHYNLLKYRVVEGDHD